MNSHLGMVGSTQELSKMAEKCPHLQRLANNNKNEEEKNVEFVGAQPIFTIASNNNVEATTMKPTVEATITNTYSHILK